jgi:hypothetical protein
MTHNYRLLRALSPVLVGVLLLAASVNKPGRAYDNHLKRYGHPSQVGCKEVLRDWNPTKLDPAKLTKIYEDAGARFLMIQVARQGCKKYGKSG